MELHAELNWYQVRLMSWPLVTQLRLISWSLVTQLVLIYCACPGVQRGYAPPLLPGSLLICLRVLSSQLARLICDGDTLSLPRPFNTSHDSLSLCGAEAIVHIYMGKVKSAKILTINTLNNIQRQPSLMKGWRATVLMYERDPAAFM